MNAFMHVAKSLLLAMAINGCTSMTVTASEREIVINNYKLSSEQVALLEQRHCAYIPSGRYWLNLYSGAWGYEGNSLIQGYLGDPCRRHRHRSLSERGLLYTPNDLRFR